MLLLKFKSPLLKKKQFDLHVFSRQHENFPYNFFRLCRSNGKTNFHVRFYVYARHKYHHYYLCRHNLVCIHKLVSLFLFRLLKQTGICKSDIERSKGFAGVFGVHCLIRVPSLCRAITLML